MTSSTVCSWTIDDVNTPELVWPGSFTPNHHNAFGGGCCLGSNGPLGDSDSRIAIWSDQPNHGAAISYGIRTATRLADGLPDVGGRRWFNSTDVWTTDMIVPRQTRTDRLHGSYGIFGYKNMNDCAIMLTQQSALNGGLGSLIVTVWNNQFVGGQPMILRQVGPHRTSLNPNTPNAGRDEFVPACTNSNLQALPWVFDEFHTVAPYIGDTGFYNGGLGQGRGGTISNPAVQLVNGGLIVPMYGRGSSASGKGSVNVLLDNGDDGQTWPDHIEVSLDGDDYGAAFQEPGIVRLVDNSLFMMARTTVGAGFERVYWYGSADGLTWSDMHIVRPGENGMGAFPGGASARCAMINPGDGFGGDLILHAWRDLDFARRISWSGNFDRGVTWSRPRILSPGAGVVTDGPGGWSTYPQFDVDPDDPDLLHIWYSCESNPGAPDSINGKADVFYTTARRI